MYWKEYEGHENAYIFSTMPKEGFVFMNDDLFDVGSDGCWYMKDYLTENDENYSTKQTKVSLKDTQAVAEYSDYLDQTRYVIDELCELYFTSDENYEIKKDEYQDILNTRKEYRQAIKDIVGE